MYFIIQWCFEAYKICLCLPLVVPNISNLGHASVIFVLILFILCVALSHGNQCAYLSQFRQFSNLPLMCYRFGNQKIKLWVILWKSELEEFCLALVKYKRFGDRMVWLWEEERSYLKDIFLKIYVSALSFYFCSSSSSSSSSSSHFWFIPVWLLNSWIVDVWILEAFCLLWLWSNMCFINCPQY